MYKIFSLIALCAVMCVVGCSKDDNSPNNPNNNSNLKDWDWLKVGNKWEYATFFGKSDNPRYPMTNELIYEDVQEINISYYVYSGSNKTKIATKKPAKVFYTFNNIYNESYWTLTDEFIGDGYGSPEVFINSYVGQKWEVDAPDYIHSISEVVSLNTKVTTPSGTFNCIKIIHKLAKDANLTNPKNRRESYFCKKYGFIQHSIIENDTIFEARKLISKNF